MIVIIKGCGANIASVQFALERLGKKSLLTNDIDAVKSASHVILPGVGSAKQAMNQLKNFNLVKIICSLKQPVLGICLGMQVLYQFSHEGNVDCLGVFPGVVESLPEAVGISIPHIGWNQLEINHAESDLLKNIQHNSYFYYVHSYAASVGDSTIATSQHGKRFSAIAQNKNFYGVQFHPEKSGKTGEKILQNFLELR